ncbi:MAG: hypothetical protein IPI35_20615 [Deltaproteobacteria bacterium]|nr:hypothetical protein [Deltaproteobacteria bacterium]
MTERRALVIGATGQLGPAICRGLKASGFGLVLVARRPAPLTRLARGLRARALPWDITRDPALLLDLAGPVTLLVNAAVRRPLPAAEEATWSPGDHAASVGGERRRPCTAGSCLRRPGSPSQGSRVLLTEEELRRAPTRRRSPPWRRWGQRSPRGILCVRCDC